MQRELKASGFLFHDSWAQVLPGKLEGAYAWVAANFLKGTFAAAKVPPNGNAGDRTGFYRVVEAGTAGVDGASSPPSSSSSRGSAPKGSLGVLEMGGASTQITFAVDSVSAREKCPDPAAFLFEVSPWGAAAAATAGLPANTLPAPFTLYTHSYLGYGQDAAFSAQRLAFAKGAAGGGGRAGGDPCLVRGMEYEYKPAGSSGSSPASVTLPRVTLSSSPANSPDIVRGHGDYELCRAAVREMFRASSAPCAGGGGGGGGSGRERRVLSSSSYGCSWNGVYRPPYPPGIDIMATENFFYTTSDLPGERVCRCHLFVSGSMRFSRYRNTTQCNAMEHSAQCTMHKH